MTNNAPANDRDPDLAVSVTGVTKTYRGNIQALRGVDMKIHRGEIFGLLGPNGAGKSTLVKILMTVIRPTQAAGTMLGKPIGHKPTLARVGYLPEHHRFPEYLTGAQVVEFYGAMGNVPRRESVERARRLLEFVGMSSWADVKVKKYSKGMRQRIGIAQALVNDPDLVVLDEPTDGVDPMGRRDIRAMLQQIRSRGKTVLVNSHLLSELEMVCDRVAILVQGKVSSQGTIDELTRDRQMYEVELTQDDPATLERVRAALSQVSRSGQAEAGWGAARLLTGEAVRVNGATVQIRTADAAVVQPVIDALRSAREVIKGVRVVRPSLEDLFMAAVTDPNTGAEAAPGATTATRSKPAKIGGGA